MISFYTCLTVLATFISLGGAIDYKYLNLICNREITVDGDLLITLSPWFSRTCHVSLVPKSGDRIVARITSYHFDGLKNIIGLIDGTCKYESLQISVGTNGIFDGDGFCGALRPTRQYDLGPKGSVSYISTNVNWSPSMRAEILVTEVFDKQEKCGKDQFDCDTKDYCVSEDVTCNGYDDCGNDRDEIKGCGLTIPIIVGIVIGCICFVVLVIVIGVCVVKKLR